MLDFYADGLHASANLDNKFTDAFRGGVNLNAEERKQVIAFLNTLNDSVFVKDERFSDPFH